LRGEREHVGLIARLQPAAGLCAKGQRRCAGKGQQTELIIGCNIACAVDGQRIGAWRQVEQQIAVGVDFGGIGIIEIAIGDFRAKRPCQRPAQCRVRRQRVKGQLRRFAQREREAIGFACIDPSAGQRVQRQSARVVQHLEQFGGKGGAALIEEIAFDRDQIFARFGQYAKVDVAQSRTAEQQCSIGPVYPYILIVARAQQVEEIMVILHAIEPKQLCFGPPAQDATGDQSARRKVGSGLPRRFVKTPIARKAAFAAR